MPAKPNAYLVQLRDQIAKSFNLEELRALTFDLQLDWEELEGSRKTARIQDLVTKLARNGKLEDLVELLKKYRPRATWPIVPAPEEQKQDIRTIFPKKPFWERKWFLGLAAIIALLAGIAGFWADSGLKEFFLSTPTPTSFPNAGWIIFIRQAETIELAQESVQNLLKSGYENIVLFEKEDNEASFPFVVALGPYPSQTKAFEQLEEVTQEIGNDAYVGQLSQLCPNECKSFELPEN